MINFFAFFHDIISEIYRDSQCDVQSSYCSILLPAMSPQGVYEIAIFSFLLKYEHGHETISPSLQNPISLLTPNDDLSSNSFYFLSTKLPVSLSGNNESELVRYLKY